MRIKLNVRVFRTAYRSVAGYMGNAIRIDSAANIKF